MKKTPFDFFIGATRPITNFNRIASGADNLEKKELARSLTVYSFFIVRNSGYSFLSKNRPYVVRALFSKFTFSISDFAIKTLGGDESNNVNNKGRKAVFPLRASVRLPPRFSLFVNQNYYNSRLGSLEGGGLQESEEEAAATSNLLLHQNEEFQRRRTDSASSRVSIQVLNNQIMTAEEEKDSGLHRPSHQVVFVSFLRLVPKQVESNNFEGRRRSSTRTTRRKSMGSNTVISVRMTPSPMPREEFQVLLELPQVSFPFLSTLISSQTPGKLCKLNPLCSGHLLQMIVFRSTYIVLLSFAIVSC